MTITHLDVARLPKASVFEHPDLSRPIDMDEFGAKLERAVKARSETGDVKYNDSYGFVMCEPFTLDDAPWRHWNDPYQFVWWHWGYGPEQDGYKANGTRKLRPTLRLHKDSLAIELSNPELFRDVVESASKNPALPWGDFPYGGAAGTYSLFGDLCLMGACSALTQREDHQFTRMCLDMFETELLDAMA